VKGATKMSSEDMRVGLRILGLLTPVLLVVLGFAISIALKGFTADQAQTQILEDFETGDFSKLRWETGGDAPWIISEVSHGGAYAAQAGKIGDNGVSWLQVTLVVSEGSITFWYKTSSEPFDALRFLIDGEEVLKASGEADWQKAEYEVSAGPHTFRWEYTKDRSRAAGQDTAWIDDITFSNICHYEVVAPGVFRVTPLQSIQKALDDAGDGFTILVTSGTHVGNLRITKGVTLRGEEGSIIQGELVYLSCHSEMRDYNPPVLWIGWGRGPWLQLRDQYSEAPNRPSEIKVRLEGLEVRPDPRALSCDLYSPFTMLAVTNVSLIVRNCTIHGVSDVYGGQAELTDNTLDVVTVNAEAIIERNKIGKLFLDGEVTVVNNTVGGIYLGGGRFTIERNMTGVIRIWPYCEAIIRGNEIVGAYTGYVIDPAIVIDAQQSTVELVENRIINWTTGVKIHREQQGVQGDSKVSIQGNVISLEEGPAYLSAYGIELYADQVRPGSSRVSVDIKDNVIQGFMFGIFVHEPEDSREDITLSREIFTVTGSSNQMRNNRLDLLGPLPGTLRAPLVPETSRTVVRVPGDYDSIQEAVDAVAPGGKVLLGAGAFTIRSSIIVWKPVTIEGAGRDRTTVGFEPATRYSWEFMSWPGFDTSVITVTHGVDGVTLRALTLQNTSWGILAYGAFSLDNCRIRFLDAGVTVAGGGDVVIRDSELSFLRAIEDGLYVLSAVYVPRCGEARITLNNNTFGGGGLKWGVFLQTRCGHPLWGTGAIEPFPGAVRGSGNKTEASFCPSELSFLTTSAGGCYGDGCR
jgi:hypothetical protein